MRRPTTRRSWQRMARLHVGSSLRRCMVGSLIERFTRVFKEKYQDLATRPADDPSLSEDVVPRKKSRIFGFGTSHNPMFKMTGTPSTLSNGQSYPFALTPEL